MESGPERIRFCTACGRALQWQALRCKTCGAHLRPTGPRRGPVLPAPLVAERPHGAVPVDYRLKGDPRALVRVHAPWPRPDMGYLAADVAPEGTDDEAVQRAIEALVAGVERRVVLVREEDGGVRVQAVWRAADGRFEQAPVGRLPAALARQMRARPAEDLGARLRLLLAPTAARRGALRIDVGATGAPEDGAVAADPTPLAPAPRAGRAG